MRQRLTMMMVTAILGATLACGADGGVATKAGPSASDGSVLADGAATNDGAADAAEADAAARADDAAAADTAAADTAAVADADWQLVDAAPADVAPAGPCGNKVGDVLCNADLRGYLSTATTGKASDAPYLESFSLAEVMAKTTPKFAMVLLGAWW